MKLSKPLMALLALATVAGLATLYRPVEAITVKVRRVVDGDTLVVGVVGKNRRVRVLGIDTPERKSRYTQEEPFGKEASARTRELVMGATVTLLFEGESRTDKYGRLLAHVILPDGRSLGEILLKEGLAEAYRRFRYSHKKRYRRLEREARAACVGLWASRRECRKK